VYVCGEGMGGDKEEDLGDRRQLYPIYAISSSATSYCTNRDYGCHATMCLSLHHLRNFEMDLD
jgi:hypothetical protein